MRIKWNNIPTKITGLEHIFNMATMALQNQNLLPNKGCLLKLVFYLLLSRQKWTPFILFF